MNSKSEHFLTLFINIWKWKDYKNHKNVTGVYRTAYGFLATNYTFYSLPYLCTISLLICHLSLKHRMNMHSQELRTKQSKQIQLPAVFIAIFVYTKVDNKVTKVNYCKCTSIAFVFSLYNTLSRIIFKFKAVWLVKGV